MLEIRVAQMEAFEQTGLRAFEDQMVNHLGRFSPQHCAGIGQDAVRQTIRLGIQRAGSHDLTNRGPVRFYLEMMFMLGSAFDTDPQLPWAAQILGSAEFTDQMQRADRLFDAAMAYRNRVVGPSGTYALTALHRMSVLAQDLLPVSAGESAAGILAQMKRIHPEKCACVGDGPLLALIDAGREKAATYQFLTPRSTLVFVVAMFTLGHGFTDDPLFPWIARTLKDPGIADAATRAMRLEERLLVYLAHVLRQSGRT